MWQLMMVSIIACWIMCSVASELKPINGLWDGERVTLLELTVRWGRLPNKDLFSFRTVSKRFNELIGSIIQDRRDALESWVRERDYTIKQITYSKNKLAVAFITSAPFSKWALSDEDSRALYDKAEAEDTLYEYRMFAYATVDGHGAELWQSLYKIDELVKRKNERAPFFTKAFVYVFNTQHAEHNDLLCIIKDSSVKKQGFVAAKGPWIKWDEEMLYEIAFKVTFPRICHKYAPFFTLHTYPSDVYPRVALTPTILQPKTEKLRVELEKNSPPKNFVCADLHKCMSDYELKILKKAAIAMDENKNKAIVVKALMLWGNRSDIVRYLDNYIGSLKIKLPNQRILEISRVKNSVMNFDSARMVGYEVRFSDKDIRQKTLTYLKQNNLMWEHGQATNKKQSKKWDKRFEQAVKFFKHKRMVVKWQGNYIICYDTLSNSIRATLISPEGHSSRLLPIIKVPHNTDPFDIDAGKILDHSSFPQAESSSEVESSTDDE